MQLLIAMMIVKDFIHIFTCAMKQLFKIREVTANITRVQSYIFPFKIFVFKRVDKICQTFKNNGKRNNEISRTDVNNNTADECK